MDKIKLTDIDFKRYTKYIGVIKDKYPKEKDSIVKLFDIIDDYYTNKSKRIDFKTLENIAEKVTSVYKKLSLMEGQNIYTEDHQIIALGVYMFLATTELYIEKINKND